MKNLKKSLAIMLVMMAVALVFMIKGVNANSFTLTPLGNTTGNTTSLIGDNTVATNTATLNPTQNATTKVNTVSDGNKDLPQTGENDIYIVTTIGVIAIAIGGFAYIRSKKMM